MPYPRAHGKIVYGSWSDGSDIYKDSKGYYIMQWDVVKEKGYKQYLPKSWKPEPPDPSFKMNSRKSKKTKKTKKNKTKRRK